MVTNARQKILVVDDEPLIRRTIRKGLSTAGYECLEVGDSLEALDNIKSVEPDLVILDIIMPGKSGRELLSEIVSLHPDVAVIMSTAIDDPRTIIDCMKLGAEDYLTKPFDIQEIVSSVDKVLEMKQLKQEINEYQKQLERTVDDQKNQIRTLFLKSIESLVYALEAKDKYTAGHSKRVTKYAIAIGKEMGLSGENLDDLRWGALLHDVGKIAIDPAVQNKPGYLTDEEYRHMMTHAMIGAGIIKPLASEGMIEIVVHHHDRFDNIAATQTVNKKTIPLGARIVTIADAFDAMISDRPYRAALPLDTALEEIKRCTGTQFDPSVVSVFLALPIQKIIALS